MSDIAIDRRQLLKTAVIGTMSFKLGGCDITTTPREAKSLGADLQSLSTNEARMLDRLGEILLPGAQEAGFSHFIDAQISNAPGDFLSMLRYMDWLPPYKSFYTDGLAALDALSHKQHSDSFAKISADNAIKLVRAISAGSPRGWVNQAPPPPLFYFITRSDAIDVVYGTKEGFERLDIPYLGHIDPVESW